MLLQSVTRQSVRLAVRAAGWRMPGRSISTRCLSTGQHTGVRRLPALSCLSRDMRYKSLAQRVYMSSSSEGKTDTDAPPSNVEDVYGSVVKIYTTSSPWSWGSPWQKRHMRSATGSGFIIEDKKIITNAHCISDNVFLQVRLYGEPKKWTARVLSVAHEVDLALLEVIDPEFWDSSSTPITPLELGDIPDIRDQVTVIGYPTGGDNLSVTSGVVSRIDICEYVHGNEEHLSIQVDAAINDGNSGGPAFAADNRVTGVAFQNLEDGENISYIIPTPVVRWFLSEAKLGIARHPGIPHLGITTQLMGNDTLREHHHMDQHSGVLVTRVAPNGPSANVLQKFDVLLEVDGREVANDGTILLRRSERISYQYLVNLKSRLHDQSTKVKVLRQGKVLDFEIPIAPYPYLVPRQAYDLAPRFCIFGGIVCTPLTYPYLYEWGKDWEEEAPRELVKQALDSDQTPDVTERVVVAQVLPHDVNEGYEDIDESIILSVNGETLKDFDHLCRILRTTKDRYVSFELSGNEHAVLDRKKAVAANPELLERFSIRYDGLWKEPPVKDQGEHDTDSSSDEESSGSSSSRSSSEEDGDSNATSSDDNDDDDDYTYEEEDDDDDDDDIVPIESIEQLQSFLPDIQAGKLKLHIHATRTKASEVTELADD